jgi:multicomponent Na+:H+ antiporter subunit G
VSSLPVVLTDALVIVGLVFMTLGVVGVLRMPDAYSKLHAQSKAVALGAVCLLAAAALRGQAPNALVGLLVAAFLLATSPVSAHAVGRAAWRRGEPMRGERVVDESPVSGEPARAGDEV